MVLQIHLTTDPLLRRGVVDGDSDAGGNPVGVLQSERGQREVPLIPRNRRRMNFQPLPYKRHTGFHHLDEQALYHLGILCGNNTFQTDSRYDGRPFEDLGPDVRPYDIHIYVVNCDSHLVLGEQCTQECPAESPVTRGVGRRGNDHVFVRRAVERQDTEVHIEGPAGAETKRHDSLGGRLPCAAVPARARAFGEEVLDGMTADVVLAAAEHVSDGRRTADHRALTVHNRCPDGEKG
ncbi:hypothetical protein ABZ359_41000 [Streptomyces sp. NPDC005968]|uniref:hypothetical protein n=1 Tax=Streptomyces sp. NPDC005968 TaxID=3154574 RepID=UPI0033D4259D